jgi:dienelactone hydrolase
MDAASGRGLLGLVLAALPGAMMLTTAVGFLFFPGDRGLARTGALGAVVGMIFAIPMLLAAPAAALGLFLVSAAGLVACGLIGVEGLPLPAGLDPAPRDLRIGAEVGMDEAVLGVAAITMGVFSGGEQGRVAKETAQCIDWFADNGWLEAPATFHDDPPALETGEIGFETRSVSGFSLEVMSFDSGYTPRADAPGAQRYFGYTASQRCFAWVLRGDEGAPWLVNIHGLTMGQPRLDLWLLQADLLHRKLGFNLVFPVLPLHGPRGQTRISGRGYLTGEVMDTLHAEAQAVWDVRRIIGWLWNQGVERIGVHGVSLGGYTAALVASLEQGLRCVIAGIPAADPAWLTWWHASAAARAAAEDAGLTLEDMSTALRVVSPLALDLQVPGAHRYVYAGRADRFVPPVVVERLWQHWGQPAIHWYPGSHLAVPLYPDAVGFLAKAAETSLKAQTA